MHPSLNVHSYHCQRKRHSYKNIQEVHCSIHEEVYCSQCHNHRRCTIYCVFHHQCGLYYLRSHLFLFADPESEDDGVCCECKNSVDDVHWVACDECNSWYHLSCTDLDESPGPVDVWICTLCVVTYKLSCTHPNCCFAAVMADQRHFNIPLTHSFQITSPAIFGWKSYKNIWGCHILRIISRWR